MKIIFISGHYPPKTKGGGEISTHLIAKGLIKKGHEVVVITDGETNEEVDFEGVRVVRRRLNLGAKPLNERRHTKKIAGRLRIESGKLIGAGNENDWIIAAHDFRSAMALAELDVSRIVATIRDYAPVCGTTNNILYDGSRCHCTWKDVFKTQRVKEAGFLRGFARAGQYRFNIGYRKKLFSRLENQIYISEEQMKEVGEQLDLSGINKQVIYNPIPEDFMNAPAGNNVAGEVLYVGRVEDYKGVGLLIEAWRGVAKAVPESRLRIIGEGAQKEQYIRRVENLGLNYTIKFDSYIPWDRMIKEYDKARVVVVPHRWTEPFGRTAAEGMARGKIVIAADIGGPKEMIQDGVSGLLFKKDDENDLSEKIIEALKMDRGRADRIGEAAREWVRDNLTMDRISAQYELFYKEVGKYKS